MLDLDILQPDQFRRVYEWNYWPEIESFESYLNRVSRPSWMHYSINNDGAFIGAISFEDLGPGVCGFHLAMQPAAVRSSELRDMFWTLGRILFDRGIEKICTEIRSENRAARLLAATCGMKPSGSDFEYRRFALTKEEFYGSA